MWKPYRIQATGKCNFFGTSGEICSEQQQQQTQDIFPVADLTPQTSQTDTLCILKMQKGTDHLKTVKKHYTE